MNEIIINQSSKQTDINQAIQKCTKNGGGKIVIKPGLYNSGPIELKSNIEFVLEEGAVIMFSDTFSDYPPVKSRYEGTNCYGHSPCFFAFNSKNISIRGGGVLDGNGRKWWKKFDEKRKNNITEPLTDIEKQLAELNKDIDTSDLGGGNIGAFFFRPPLIQFNNCTNVELEGITAQNSPFWNTHFVYSKDIKVSNVTFKNPSDGFNNDGLDIDSCNGVDINGCTFDVNDDCLCFKAGIGKDGMRVNIPCENIKARNCKMVHGHGGIVMGSDTAGGIRNIEVSDCQMQNTDRGIRVKSRRGRGGTVENIMISNIEMQNVSCPITMNLYYMCGVSDQNMDFTSSRKKQIVSESTPILRDIKITNVKVEGFHSAGIFLLGLPESPIENLVLENIQMTKAQNIVPDIPAMALGIDKCAGKETLIDYVKNISFANIIF